MQALVRLVGRLPSAPAALLHVAHAPGGSDSWRLPVCARGAQNLSKSKETLSVTEQTLRAKDLELQRTAMDLTAKKSECAGLEAQVGEVCTTSSQPPCMPWLVPCRPLLDAPRGPRAPDGALCGCRLRARIVATCDLRSCKIGSFWPRELQYMRLM